MAERGNGRVMEIWNCGMDATAGAGVLQGESGDVEHSFGYWSVSFLSRVM